MEIGTDPAVTGRQQGDIDYPSLQLSGGGRGIGSVPGKTGREVPVPVQGNDVTQAVNLPRNPAMVQAVHGGTADEGVSEGEGVLHIFFAKVEGERTNERDTPGKGIETGHPGTILLVDDDPIIIGLLGIMLANLGFTVLSAGDGLDALDLFNEHKEVVRLVMTDVYMPRMDGWDTLEAVRQINPEMPVILFSGCSEEQVMKELRSEAPQAFLKKPFGFDLLRDTIQRILTDTM